MFEEHFNSDTLMAVVLCSFALVIIVLVLAALLVGPGMEQRAKMKKEEHDDYRGVAREEYRKFVKSMVEIRKIVQVDRPRDPKY